MELKTRKESASPTQVDNHCKSILMNVALNMEITHSFESRLILFDQMELIRIVLNKTIGGIHQLVEFIRRNHLI